MGEMQVFDVSQEQESGTYKGAAYGEGIAPRTFKTFIEECRYQPPWRNMADKCADYYDGNQLDEQTLTDLDRKGMGPLQRNIIQPLVNVVLGMEEKTRSDWRVSADNDALQEVAEAMSAKLHEGERETRADKACSDGYAGQIKAGLGWVEVSKNADPFEYAHRVQHVHRREIWWDWRDESADLAKSRFLIRKRWFDADQAVAYFPQVRELILAAVSGDPHRYEMQVAKRGLELGMSLDDARDVDIEDYEQWRTFDRRRVCMYETWYRTFCRGHVAKLPNGEVIELDPRNPVHLALLSRGAIQAQQAVYSKLRMAMFIGPHLVMDCACPKRHMPYVPFWGYREDRTGVPYGLVRAMLSPQDEVNARLQKMMWLLGAKRVMMDADALDPEMQSAADMLAELSRPDSVIFLNPKRMNRDGAFQVNDNLTLADAQFRVLQDALQASQQVIGVFNAMLGRESQSASGLAINSLVEQGTTALAEINGNYRYARRLVGERLLDQLRDEMIGQAVDVVAGLPGRRRVISLNQPVQAQQNGQMVEAIKNDLRATRLRCALDDVPSSPAYREQQFTMLAELTKGLPPNLQAIVAPFILEASDLQRRRELADTLRKAIGMPIPRTPEEERAAEQAQAQAMQFAQEIQQKQALLELQEREAKVMKLRAEAERAMADARKIMAEAGGNPALETARGEHETRVRAAEEKARVEIDRITAENMRVKLDAARREQLLLAKLTDAVATLKANAGNREAEQRKAEIEREIAQIEAERDRDVARIEADAKRVVESMTVEVASLRDELLKRIEASEKATAKEAERQRKEDERRRKEDERSAREREGARKPEPAPAQNLSVKVEGGGEREVEVTLPNGQKIKGTSKPKKRV